jgi:putative ribosome biogenesis GTPase RsgA
MSGARPIILLNKADLRSYADEVVRLTEEHAPGVRVLALSALAVWGLEEISRQVELGQTAALMGSSGTGNRRLSIGCWVTNGNAQRPYEIPTAKADILRHAGN